MKRFVNCFGTIIVCAFSIIFSANALAFPSETTVRVYGKVTDESGEPVPEATVMFISQKDTTSTLTDNSGMYSVDLSPESTNVSENPSPEIFLLHQNYPNPFNPSTVIQYELKSSAHVKLNIYNVAGQVVRSLIDNTEVQGTHSVQWDGRDNDGKGVSAGVYLYRLQAGGFSQTKKMVLLDGGGSGNLLSHSVSVFNKLAKISKTNEAYYDIVVEKEGYEIYNEEDYVVPKGVSELIKDIVLTNYDFFPLAYSNFWDFRKLNLENEKVLNETFSISIIDTTIINEKKYFLMLQGWNDLLPDTLYVRKEAFRVFWHMNGKDLMVYDFEATLNSSWEVTLSAFGNNKEQILIIKKLNMDDVSLYNQQYLKFSIQGSNVYWFESFAINIGLCIIIYPNQDFGTEVTGVVEYVSLLDKECGFNYDYPSLWRTLSSMFTK